MPNHRAYSGACGVLAVLSPVPMMAAAAVETLFVDSWWLTIAAFLLSVLLLSGALLLNRDHRRGRVLVTIGIVGTVTLMAEGLILRPAATLVVLVLVLGGGYLVWIGPNGLLHSLMHRSRDKLSSCARGACLSLVCLWLVLSLLGTPQRSPEATPWAVLSSVIAMSILVIWVRNNWSRHTFRAVVISGGVMLGLWGILLCCSRWDDGIIPTVLAGTVGMAFLPHESRASRRETLTWWEPVISQPERLLVSTFLVLCLLGTLLLALPISSSSGSGLKGIDAAFTSVSAVCVTGLIVLDTPVDFSPFGQAVILVLIQLGGLGIMTFSVVAIQLMGRRLSLRQEGVVAGLFSLQDRNRLFRTATTIVVFTFGLEAAGAGLLFFQFLGHGDSLGQALWRAGFTSVSAFCNAGFSLQSDSLVQYQNNLWILHIVAVLIVMGGLSPAAVLYFPTVLRRRSARIPAQIRLIWVTNASLLLFGFVSFLTFEWSHTLTGLGLWDSLHNSWFQSVTLRTAGFNSVSFTDLQPATFTVMILLMLIGGSPGGTAGGIKTTTFALLLLSASAAVRGRFPVIVFSRAIPHRTVYKAAAIATAGVASVILGVLAIQVTQAIPSDMALFEVVSALGTVGLSLGGTGLLDEVGKAIIIVCMFAGRVGPLTLFVFLSQRARRIPWEMPEEEIPVG